MKNLTIGLIGFGTIGTGVVKTLYTNRARIENAIGAPVHLKWIADLDITTDRGVDVEQVQVTTDAMQVISDPEVDIVIELIGGCTVARNLILEALRNGKSVVTANKALLAECGREVFAVSSESKGLLAYEASVCGGIPIIKALREGLAANNILEMYGIVNGTANYILSKMSTDSISYETALAQAQELGYAEADPTLDVQGVDAAHKLCILASLATGTIFSMDDIYVEGIDRITDKDIEYAFEFGRVIKLLAVFKRHSDSVELRVHPTLLPESHLLSSVMDSYNAVFITGDIVENNMYYGRGAGEMPTASAVVADIIDLGKACINGGVNNHRSFCLKNTDVPVRPMYEVESRYYLRFNALDRTGVLAQIASILGKYNISISDVYQKERNIGDAVPLIMITHDAQERAVQQALLEIDQLDVVRDKTHLIRMED